MTDKLQTKQGRVWIEPKVTPTRAAELLKQLHPGQRQLRDRHVEAIARAMREGRFLWTGDAIRLDANERVIDGQHRLAACVKAGVPMLNVVFATVYDSSAIQHIDTSAAPRSLNDIRRIQGQGRVQSIVVGAIVYEFCDFVDADKALLTKTEKNELVTTCEFLPEITKLFDASRKMAVTAGPLAGALRCLRANKTQAMRFFTAAFSNHPVIDGQQCEMAKLLADYLIGDLSKRRADGTGRGKSRVDSHAGAYKAIQSYNAWRTGNRLMRLQRGEAMPKAVA